ncbi:uncharacterized protein TM35_000531030, partial [Trypanosoma theileri]
GYTMTAAAAVDDDSPSGRGVSRGAVEVSCGAGGALRVRPAAESEWLTCGAGSRVSACGKYADLCRQRTARTARTTTIATTTTAIAGQPKAVMATHVGVGNWDDFLAIGSCDSGNGDHNGNKKTLNGVDCGKWKEDGSLDKVNHNISNSSKAKDAENVVSLPPKPSVEVSEEQEAPSAEEDRLRTNTLHPTSTGTGSGRQATESGPVVTHPSESASDKAQPGRNAERAPEASSTSSEPPSSLRAPEDSSTTSAASTNESTGNSLPGDNNTTQQPSYEGTTAPNSISGADSQQTTTNYVSTGDSASGADTGVSGKTEIEETTSTTPPSIENTVSESPSPSPVTVSNTVISTIASTVQNKGNVDSSSVSPVWMRTAAPLLIVAVLFSVTLY